MWGKPMGKYRGFLRRSLLSTLVRLAPGAAFLVGVAMPSAALGGTPAVSLGAPTAMYSPAAVAAGPFLTVAPAAASQPEITQAVWLGQTPEATPLVPEEALSIQPDFPPPIAGDVFHLSPLPDDAPGGPQGSGWFDNLSLFLGLDGSKGPDDLGINADFGYRGAINWGLPLWESRGLGIQVGSALNVSDNAVRVLRSVNGTRDRVQSFTTVGVFQRTDFGLNWGIVYDFLAEDYYKSLVLGQWRGQIGHAIGLCDEVGVWAAVRNFGDNATVAGQSLSLKPITQGNLYWRHVWGNETVTRFWVGLAEEHGRFVLVAPGNSSVHHPFVFGADLYVPLTDRLAIYGEANFITPNDTGTVTATMGIVFYPGGRAKGVARGRFAPLLPLANNPTFGVDARQ